jgi:hypothetical protein
MNGSWHSLKIPLAATLYMARSQSPPVNFALRAKALVSGAEVAPRYDYAIGTSNLLLAATITKKYPSANPPNLCAAETKRV